MQKFFRGPFIYILLLVVIVIIVNSVTDPIANKEVKLDYSGFLLAVEEQKVDRVAISARYELFGLYKGSPITPDRFPKNYDFVVQAPYDILRIYGDLDIVVSGKLGIPAAEITSKDYGFAVDVMKIPTEPWWYVWGPTLLLLAAIGIFTYIMIKQQGGGGNNKVMNFGRSRARLADDKKRITFAMVAGAEEEKEELQEIVEFLNDPRRFVEMGARIPKGVLLVGPPGTGKTYLARAVAGEAEVPFFSISGSDFVEMFVGVGASRVRDLFEQAKKNFPSIIFIDEIDAVGRHRGAGLGGGHDEREQTLNQLLVEMDGFSTNEGIIIIAATNRPDILDPALLRPGRFDRQISVNLPDIKGREAVLKVHSLEKPLGPDIDLHTLAKRTPYCSPADLENIMNESALLAARRKKTAIEMIDVEEAISRVQMGPEKRSAVVTEKDKKIVAYHEAGHAVVAHFLEHCDAVHEVSIIPRGRAGGYTMVLPEQDSHYVSRAELNDQIAMCMGGNAAERLVFGDTTTGAGSDLRKASSVARRMITEYGMNDEVGPFFLGGHSEEVFLGRDYGQARSYSEEMAARIDEEQRKLLSDRYGRATSLLQEHLDDLHKIAGALMEKEKLSGDEFRALLGELLPAAQFTPQLEG